MAKNQQLVLGFFESEAAANHAVEELKGFDKVVEGVKFDNIGVLVKDDKGKVKAKMDGPRRTGAGILLGALAAVLTGGLSLIAGVVLGGALGHFAHKSLGMSKDDLARISKELDGGKAAVGVLVNENEAKAVTAWMETVGGKPETHQVSEEATNDAAAVLDEHPEAETTPEAAAPTQAAVDAAPPAEGEAKS